MPIIFLGIVYILVNLLKSDSLKAMKIIAYHNNDKHFIEHWILEEFFFLEKEAWSQTGQVIFQSYLVG